MYAPRIVQVQSTDTDSLFTLSAVQANALTVRIERTSEPVWPEDEAAELARPGAVPVPLLGDAEADAVLRQISVCLPDQLTAVPVRPAQMDAARGGFSGELPDWLKTEPAPPDAALGGDSAELPTEPLKSGRAQPDDRRPPKLDLTALLLGDAQGRPAPARRAAGWEHVAFSVPASFAAPESLVLCRMRLELMLTSDGWGVPVAVYLRPEPAVEVTSHKVAEVSIDVGKLVTALFPGLPAAFTASAGGSIELSSVHPKIQVDGLQRHECTWLVSDARIGYNFSPSVIARFPAWGRLRVSARLHVEVRKRVLGVFRKTYGKSASPMSYVYEPGQSVMAAFGYPSRLKDFGAQRDQHGNRLTGAGALARLGELTRDADPGESRAWYERAADAGSADAMITMSELAQDQDEAAQWKERAASAGGVRVMIRLGDRAAADDPDEAWTWYERAAQRGSVAAMLKLVRLTPDDAQAAGWKERAASAGGSGTMVELGDLARERDRGEAQSWYQRAAAAGDTSAMIALGRFLEDWDRREAGQWYAKAAAAGDRAGRDSLKRLYGWRYWFMRRPDRRA